MWMLSIWLRDSWRGKGGGGRCEEGTAYEGPGGERQGWGATGECGGAGWEGSRTND